MSTTEIIQQLTTILEDKDRKIAELEELVKNQSKALSTYFAGQCTECKCKSTTYICHKCYYPFPAQEVPVSQEPFIQQISIRNYVPFFNGTVVRHLNVESLGDGYFKELSHRLCLKVSGGVWNKDTVVVVGAYDDKDVFHQVMTDHLKFSSELGLTYVPSKAPPQQHPARYGSTAAYHKALF